jgi:hypothetical protein
VSLSHEEQKTKNMSPNSVVKNNPRVLSAKTNFDDSQARCTQSQGFRSVGAPDIPYGPQEPLHKQVLCVVNTKLLHT